MTTRLGTGSRHGWLLATLAVTSWGIGCGDETAPSGTDNPTTKSSGSAVAPAPSDGVKGEINGRLLHAIQIEADHKVEFYEFGDGETAIREPDQPVPEAIVQADGRRSAMLEARAASGAPPEDSKTAPDMLTSDSAAREAAGATRSTPAIAGAAPSELATVSSAIGTCSADQNNDSWGANWFLNNYCVQGAFRDCHTNWGWYDNQGTVRSSYYRQMEGDYNVSGHTSGQYRKCVWSIFYGWECFYFTEWNYDVLPRHVEAWDHGFGDSGWVRRAGNSPCGHLQVAFEWN